MSYETGHIPTVKDGVEGLLVQIADAVQDLADNPQTPTTAVLYEAQTLTVAQGVQAFTNLKSTATPGLAMDVWLDSTLADYGFYIKTTNGSVSMASQYINDKLIIGGARISISATNNIQLGSSGAANDFVNVQYNGSPTTLNETATSKMLVFSAARGTGGTTTGVYSGIQGNSTAAGLPLLNVYAPGAQSTTSPGTLAGTFRTGGLDLPVSTDSELQSLKPVGSTGYTGFNWTSTAGYFEFMLQDGTRMFRFNASVSYIASATTTTYLNLNAASGGGALQTASFTDRLAWSTSGVNVKGGNGADVAGVGGTLSTDTTQTGNSGTGEDTLQTATVAAATLNANGDTYAFVVAGTIANSINAKRIRVKFGGTTIFDTGAAGIPISAAIDWSIEGEIIRTGAATQKCVARMTTNNATLASYCDYSTAAETLSGAVTFLITGEAVDNNDIVKELYKGYFKR